VIKSLKTIRKTSLKIIIKVGEVFLEIEVNETDSSSGASHSSEPTHGKGEKTSASVNPKNEKKKENVGFSNDSGEEILATPAVRNLIKMNKLDIREIKGSGKNGRILKEDVNNYFENHGKEDKKRATTM
jgi:pyruvate/2-oxoglutarate dehydrogenase complex dihydrolipoamide acyltransferase (E2) component